MHPHRSGITHSIFFAKENNHESEKHHCPFVGRTARRPLVGRDVRHPMTFVVTESCIRCKYTDCVDVCPVDAFREGPNMLVIDPDDCIDCAVCVPECPVDAIYAEEDTPPMQRDFLDINARLARSWPTISRTKPALPDADTWAAVSDKRLMIDEGL